MASRSRAGSLKSQFDACRNKLRAAWLHERNDRLRAATEEETKEVRRTAKRQEGRIKFLEGEIDNLRCWLRGSHAHKERIEARHRDEPHHAVRRLAEEGHRLAAGGARPVGASRTGRAQTAVRAALSEQIAGLEKERSRTRARADMKR